MIVWQVVVIEEAGALSSEAQAHKMEETDETNQ